MKTSSNPRGQKSRQRQLPSKLAPPDPAARVPRERRAPALDSELLAVYQSALQRSPLLGAAEEQALGREIEQLKLEHWCALLSYRPALAVIAEQLATRLTRRPRKLAALRAGKAPLFQAAGARADESSCWAPETVAAAKQLLLFDADRSALAAVDEAACAAFAEDSRARAYLARVARARAAEQRAKARFVHANLRLVITMARRYARAGLLPVADLIQEGNLGLMRAVERFDHRRGYRFSTYATWWIRHYMNRSSADTARLVRVPVHALDALAQLKRANRAHLAKTGVELAPGELAQRLGIPLERLEQLQVHVGRQPLSLDRNVGDDREQTMHELLPAADEVEPEQALDLSAWREALPRLLATLAPIEQAILRFRFGLSDGEELTLSAIGEKYNLSRERIRQLQELALDKLRQTIAEERENEGLPATLDGSSAAA